MSKICRCCISFLWMLYKIFHMIFMIISVPKMQ